MAENGERPTVEGARRDPRVEVWDLLHARSPEFRALTAKARATTAREKIDGLECLYSHAGTRDTLKSLCAQYITNLARCRLCGRPYEDAAPSSVGQAPENAADRSPQGASGPP